jgi:uncharacterized OB-fold protein
VSQEPTPAIEGWFTQGTATPHLLGSSCAKCGTYFFPKTVTYCKNPACDSDEFEEVELSRTARIWSFTNGCYQPPEPYMSPDPFVPYTVIAAELAEEKMIVLGQAAEGYGVEDLKVGMEVELVIEHLFSDDDGERVVWKWKPLDAS